MTALRNPALVKLGEHRDLGLLVLRFGLGVAFMIHGYPMMAGGPAVWENVGAAMGALRINDPDVFWGFCAAFAELVGGLCLALGLFFRPATILLTITMIVATAMHLEQGEAFQTWSRPMELAFVFLGLTLVGPGRFSIDRR